MCIIMPTMQLFIQLFIFVINILEVLSLSKKHLAAVAIEWSESKNMKLN